jgi:hypothetical protein
MLVNVVPNLPARNPPRSGVQVLLRLKAAISKLNSVFDVPISRDSLDLRGPSIYVALSMIEVRRLRSDRPKPCAQLVTANAQRASTKKSSNSDNISTRTAWLDRGRLEEHRRNVTVLMCEYVCVTESRLRTLEASAPDSCICARLSCSRASVARPGASHCGCVKDEGEERRVARSCTSPTTKCDGPCQ